MLLRYYEVIQEMHAEYEEEFEEFVEGLRKKKVCLVLFGSRAEGRANLLSDYDLLVVSEERRVEVPERLPADVFIYSPEECLREVERRNTVVLDALTRGRLIFDNLGVFEKLRSRALE
ncbi:MAG: nucleotidyltransferase domain-containing protein, partial [Euryarchaeota archaeon]|nr:nucleotidyltransferase domain-containing protein [Euryarchaeota archaeon]